MDILSVKLSKHINVIHVYYIFRATTSMLSLGSHERPVKLNNSIVQAIYEDTHFKEIACQCHITQKQGRDSHPNP